MAKNSGKRGSETNELDGEVDALFRLPLAEFTGARNTLAAQLKKSGRSEEATQVKTLAKPPISAWAVNQLYWNHRHLFDSLLSSGERFHRAQTSRSAGKLSEMRDALDARREALTELSDLATSLLREAGSNPALETIRRITTTLEAMSAYASRADAPRPGRLTQDVDPPGFESLASFVPGAGVKERKQEPSRVQTSPKSIASNTRSASAPVSGVRKLDETRNANIAAAKVSLQDAKRSLTEARTRARSAEASRNKASAVAKEAEKQKREAEERLERARVTSQNAARRARTVAAEAEEATRALDYAERAVREATEKLEALFRQSPRR